MNKVAIRKNNLIIKPLPEIFQVMRYWRGAYDMATGAIEIGSTEKDTSSTLWHEFIHKYLFEKNSFESSKMWDNIADEVHDFLFDKNSLTDNPYIFTQPPKKAKSFENVHKTLKEKEKEMLDIENEISSMNFYKIKLEEYEI